MVSTIDSPVESAVEYAIRFSGEPYLFEDGFDRVMIAMLEEARDRPGRFLRHIPRWSKTLREGIRETYPREKTMGYCDTLYPTVGYLQEMAGEKVDRQCERSKSRLNSS